MTIRVKIILLLICIVAVWMRFYQLGTNPPSLTWDEAAWGYNAYTLGIDGKDEFGRFLPHDYLESFGDFKPPMYAYLDILPIKIFGLTPFATRFPSAFAGVFTVAVTFFLVRKIFWDTKNRDYYGLTAAAILAVSPWHIMLSRAAFEANIATCYLTVGVWLFLKGILEDRKYITFSVISFVLSIYTFNSARVVAPLLIFMLAIGFYKRLLKVKMAATLACIIGIVLLLPTLNFLLSPQAKIRFQEVNIFSDISIIRRTNQEIANDKNSWFAKIIHNRRLAYGGEFIRHYLDNLTPNFLFIHGDGNPKFSTQDVGQMYLWDIPFFIGGVILLVRKREGFWWIIPLWLIMGIIPAATARETPHALRIEATLPTFQIFVAYGFTSIFLSDYVKRRHLLRKTTIGLAVLLLFLNILFFQHGYFAYYPSKYSGEWQYGYKESIAYVADNIAYYDKVQITQSLGRPYIYYLFFMKTNPDIFRRTAKIARDPFGFVTIESFGKYSFSRENNEKISGNVLYIDSPVDVPKNALRLKTFYLLDGSPILIAYTL